ncbi:MAG: spondin domain-containing protein [Xenococcaceae cyanobacterium MO_234.B1]|nr:spondin domain-containing protein [Xenococcaceae cyanobacterium MO_234.B1]
MSEITLRITVENVAPQQGIGLAPFWVAFHDGSFDIFNEGESASGALESLAEDGITGLERSHIPNLDQLLIESATATGFDLTQLVSVDNVIAEEFALSPAAANGGVQSTVFNPVSLPFILGQSPGETISQEITLDRDDLANNRYFSFASMLFPSNDAFIANDNPTEIEIFDAEGNFIGGNLTITGDQVWDAGTEVNDEDPVNVPYTLAEIANGIDENGTVQRHPGLQPAGTGGAVDFLVNGEPLFANSNFNQPGYEVARLTIELVETTPIPEVRVFAEPDTFLSEAQSEPGAFVFQLSAPAPEGGLTINFQAGDTDIDPTSRDVDIDLEASTNIEEVNIIPLPDVISSVTIAEGATEARLVVVPFPDEFLEPDETISVELLSGDDYAVDLENNFADLTITEDILQIIGTSQSDILQGRRTNEVIRGLGGQDILQGRRGDDWLLGGTEGDVLQGGRGDDSLLGEEGGDVLQGGWGDDLLNGGAGNDVLQGGRGNDLLNGGAGNDLLQGGRDSDRFIIASGQGIDTILNFQDDIDYLVLEGGLTFGQLAISDNDAANSTEIAVVETGEVLARVVGVFADDLTEADFLSN